MDIRYWVRATCSFLRHTVEPGFVADVVRSGLRADGATNATVRFLLDVWPDIEGVPVEIGTVEYRLSNLSPTEQYAIAAIAKLRQPAAIFEIGTYDGATTLLLARNAPGARVLTLDLDRETASTATVPGEARNARSGRVGSRFTGSAEADRIEQLYGDSRTFDFSPWHGTIDLVLIDAGHDYDCVAADTASAFRLLRPGGIVIWDDYTPGWPGVVQAVDELDRPIIQIASTDLAIYDDHRRSPAWPDTGA
jgi:predicted O-methyltransferase YrrM